MGRERVEDRLDPAARHTGRGQDAPFGAKLREFREAAGLTQEELAARAGLSAKAVSALERGERRRPYPHTVRSLADALELSEAERALLIGAIPGRRGDAPVPEGANGHAAALPASLTPLLGREREVTEISSLLSQPAVRLLTLTGLGGIGKTRLGIEAAKKAAEYFPDGVAFVSLAPLRDAALVIPTVLRVLGLREAAGVPPPEILRQHLREKSFLLVLDNFEHVAEAAPEVLDLLGFCPDLCVLVTSRAPLRVRGEHEYPVSPLAVPDPSRTPEAEEVAEASAVKLFVERAGEASTAFELTRANAAAVAAICRRLDGLPLALELAAARIRFLDPSSLLSRLDRVLEAGGARDLPQRQQTMRATLDWSHDLLSKAAKDLFRRLSVFAGGFALEAAEAVWDYEASGGELDVLALLGSLVEHSLVLAEPDGDGTGVRYRMLEPVRQYALKRLCESGEEEEARGRHARYYLALAEEAEPRIKGPDQIEWLDRLEADNDNLRAAVGWSLEAGEAQIAARFGWALRMYWVMRARQGEGRMLMEQTLERAGGNLPVRMRAKALVALATCIYGSGDDERLMAVAEESAALFRRAGDGPGEAFALGMVGLSALQMGDLDRAGRTLEESLQIYRNHEDAWGAKHILNHLAIVSLKRDNHRQAAGYAEEALALTQQTGDRLAGNTTLYLLAQVAWASDERERAARYWREALAMAFELTDKLNSTYCIQSLAAVAASRGEPRRAARLLGAAEALLEATGLILYAMARDNETHWRTVSVARERLSEELWMSARDEGRAMSFEQAVEYALEKQEPTPDTPPAPESEGGQALPTEVPDQRR